MTTGLVGVRHPGALIGSIVGGRVPGNHAGHRAGARQTRVETRLGAHSVPPEAQVAADNRVTTAEQVPVPAGVNAALIGGRIVVLNVTSIAVLATGRIVRDSEAVQC